VLKLGWLLLKALCIARAELLLCAAGSKSLCIPCLLRLGQCQSCHKWQRHPVKQVVCFGASLALLAKAMTRHNRMTASPNIH